uniref:Putative secreted protein n=2 Tax=Ixodes ricinus TaxID=34613 RepID=V5H798_IXORI
MNSLYWSSCLWLCFMCTGVESLSEFHIRPRDQDGDVTLTINYLVDEFADASNKGAVDWWLQEVTWRTQILFHSFFGFSLNLVSTTTYLVNQNDLISNLKPYKQSPFLWLDGAVEVLSNYFSDKSHADIICLVTNLTLNDGDRVIKGHGYSTQKTLCESGVSILLAYAPDQPG